MEREGRAARVQRLWEAYAHGGIDEVVGMVDDEVEWRPYGARGEVLRGTGELRRYMEERASKGDRVEAEVYSYEEYGDCVLASGHLRVRTDDGMTDTQLYWLYRFDGDRLLRFEGFASRDQALAAARDRS